MKRFDVTDLAAIALVASGGSFVVLLIAWWLIRSGYRLVISYGAPQLVEQPRTERVIPTDHTITMPSATTSRHYKGPSF